MRPITDEAKRQLVESTYRATAGNFPDVPDMAVSEAQRLLREGNIALVDVRSPEEQAVSMIEGAITAAHFDGHARAIRALPWSRTVRWGIGAGCLPEIWCNKVGRPSIWKAPSWDGPTPAGDS